MNYKNIIMYVIVFYIVVLIKVDAYCHGAIYQMENLSDNKIGITVRCDEAIKRGISIKYFHLEEAKTLYIGYEFDDSKKDSAYLEFPLDGLIQPIRIILENKKYTVFQDIDNSEYKENILHLHDYGIINGISKYKFEPKKLITRAEFMVLLLKSLKANVSSTNKSNFIDLRTHWARDYMNTAYNLGYIKGYKDNTIKPDNNITLAEVSTLIEHTFKFKTKFNGIYLKLKNDKWYSYNVKYLFDSTVLRTSDGIYSKFSEENFITREEAALILSRSLSTY